MSLKSHFMKRLRSRVWANSRRIIRLRRQALDAEKYTRYELHNQIDELKMERERDVLKIEDLCQDDEGILEEVKAGVEEVVDEVRHSLAGGPPEEG